MKYFGIELVGKLSMLKTYLVRFHRVTPDDYRSLTSRRASYPIRPISAMSHELGMQVLIYYKSTDCLSQCPRVTVRNSNFLLFDTE